MRIEQLTQSRLDAFIQFNNTIDPTRHDFYDRFALQVLNHPLLAGETELPVVIALDASGQIIGQHLHQPCQYFFGGQQFNAFFGFDFYVKQGLRGQGIGTALAKAANEQFYPHFGVGVAKVSQRILFALGNRIIGSLHQFIWICNCFSPMKFVMNRIGLEERFFNTQKINRDQFPKRISVGKFQFTLIDSLDHWHYRYWDDETLEFARSHEFMRWRFLKHDNRYFFYLLNESDSTNYIVVRKIVAKGLRLLALVDYRITGKEPARFATMIKLAKQLARLGHFDGILTMSSHRFFDEVLKQNHFWRVGRPIVILTNAKVEFNWGSVQQRTSVLATMADSDLDFYFEF
ncbi:MAG: hypothetical protein ONB13_12475 [candidate division KSB1 bacterium]|nr:hypothetical protein [candidate division KSB1 bacterium]MDZ7333742.1 hypothetical protein [candidate division KSB1 bacterium]MDZ7357049.1 hypothetical protein [candidate division KSB1 bacterium]MDZ7377420.1 hypothetical protein [candidate division KSB1 bacterium]MDZ7398832.1 hypothetical protein [candidate division KSB1 bacterium]